jgi:hypothetical protein
MKTQDQLDKECNRCLKVILTAVDEVAASKGQLTIYQLEAVKKRVKQGIWELFREAKRYDPGKV